MAVAVFSPKSKQLGAPDPKLVKDQLQGLQNMLKVWGREFFCEQFVWILRKKPEGPVLPGALGQRLINYRLNAIQVDLNDKRAKRNVIVKPRQVGLTTDHIINRLYIPAIIEPGFAGLLISQTKGYGAQHFGILHRTHRFFGKVLLYDNQHADNLLWRQLHQNLLHTQYSGRHELVFDMLDSRILVDTAENEEVGQGLPGISALVCTEVARWPHNPEETMANVKESVHGDGTVDEESTANMMAGYFWEECTRAMNEEDPEFKFFFYPWWWTEEYREKPAAKEKSLVDEEREKRAQFNWDLEQITWRRKKKISLRRNFDEKYPEDPITAFLSPGGNFFDADILARRAIQCLKEKPYAVKDNGRLILFRRRVKGRRYIVAGDPASGRMVTTSETDYCAAVVLDEMTGEEVAYYRYRLPPEDFALVLIDLAMAYNNGMIAPERNNEGGTVLLQLRHTGYGNVYEHREWDKERRKVIPIPGFPTTPKTRPIALNQLALFLRGNPELFHDRIFLAEGLSFTRDEKTGKPQAVVGAHDDTVSCRWVAHYCRLVALGYVDPVHTKRQKYGELEDDEES